MNTPLDTDVSPLPSKSPDTPSKSVDSHQKYVLLRQRWGSMELGLNDSKIALGALKSACAALEIQTERLGNELLVMKDIMDSLTLETSGPQPTQENKQTSESSGKARSGLFTPPGTPARRPGILHRVNESVGRLVHPDHISTSIFTPSRSEILGKRRSVEDTDDSTDESVNSNDRRVKIANKRVRFVDTDDLPISHMRTPMHQLDAIASGTNDHPLPIPKRVLLTLSKHVKPSTSESKGDVSGETISSPISPPSSPILLPLSKARNTRPRFRDSMMYARDSQRPRQKTRWDPATGKRVPIATPGDPSASIEVTGSGAGALTTTEDDYEGRLSHNLSNTSIG